MKKFTFASLAVVVALAITPVVANAQNAYFNFSYDNPNTGGNGIIATGWLVGSLVSGSTTVYDITSGSITFSANSSWYAGETGTLFANPNGATGAYNIVDINGGELYDDLVYASVTCSTPTSCTVAPALNPQGINQYLDYAQGSGQNPGGLLFSVNAPGDTLLWSGNNGGNGTGYSFAGNFGNNGVIAPADTTFTMTVPDGGTTLALLGLAIAGLAGLRRKLRV
jgi:hypothetical protein